VPTKQQRKLPDLNSPCIAAFEILGGIVPSSNPEGRDLVPDRPELRRENMQLGTYAIYIAAVKAWAACRDGLIGEMLLADPARTNRSIRNKLPGTTNAAINRIRQRLGLPAAIIGRPTEARRWRERSRLNPFYARRGQHAADD
jgi:hypothetical protein